jgi:hypothetical protein
MNVIGGTVDDHCHSLHYSEDASKISKQMVAELRLNQRTPPLSAGDQMLQNVAGCLRQASFAPAGVAPFVLSHPAYAVGCILAPLRGFYIHS